jgi:aldehyde:ferredoxin oxidoreductase
MNKVNDGGFFGWAGRILFIDLTQEKVTTEPLDSEVAQRFVGGDGLGAKLLFDRMPAKAHPLSPDNLFILATGPLTGTLFPSSGRLSVVFKAPATHLIGLSNVGGYLAPEIKWAGYDAIVFSGRAKEPVWVWIDNDKVEIRSAKQLWGKNTWDTIEAIHQDVGDRSVTTMVIGPAGENLVADAIALVNHTRQSEKGGSGAVMGSKNLKGIAVRGSRGTRVYNPETFIDTCRKLHKSIKDSPSYSTWADYGTNAFAPLLEQVHGALQVKNFQLGLYPEARESLGVEAIHTELVDKPNYGCYGCPIQCSHMMSSKKGTYKGIKIPGFEISALIAYGYTTMTPDLGYVLKGYDLSVKLGLSISVAYVLGWTAELYEKGIVSREDLDGLDLHWGNEEAFLELTRKIAYREGIGDILADDYETAAKRIGKNSEEHQAIITRLYTTECPRARMDVALSHLINNRGGDHHKAEPYFIWIAPELTEKLIPGISPKAGDLYTPEGKPELVVWSENAHAVVDSVGSCLFPSFLMMPEGGVHLEDYAAALTAATGVEYDREKLLHTGRRITALERCFNIREGFDRSLYEMSEKWYKTALPEGAQKGVKADRKITKQMVDDFLELKGFDSKTGFPKEQELHALGLTEVLSQLGEAGRVVR